MLFSIFSEQPSPSSNGCPVQAAFHSLLARPGPIGKNRPALHPMGAQCRPPSTVYWRDLGQQVRATQSIGEPRQEQPSSSANESPVLVASHSLLARPGPIGKNRPALHPIGAHAVYWRDLGQQERTGQPFIQQERCTGRLSNPIGYSWINGYKNSTVLHPMGAKLQGSKLPIENISSLHSFFIEQAEI